MLTPETRKALDSAADALKAGFDFKFLGLNLLAIAYELSAIREEIKSHTYTVDIDLTRVLHAIDRHGTSPPFCPNFVGHGHLPQDSIPTPKKPVSTEQH